MNVLGKNAKQLIVLQQEPEKAAKAAGLRYTTDEKSGITRKRSGKGFSYRDADGKVLTDKPTLKRIKALAIPPAWTDVWICPNDEGHLQATGRDAKGRKQSRYHPDWRTFRDQVKFGRMAIFGKKVPGIRERVEKDLERAGMSKEKVVAAIVRLLDTTGMRIGNEEYAQENGSFGLTTLRNRHAEANGHTIKLTFKGKSGKMQQVELRDRRLASIVRKCQDLPGQRLFSYQDDDGEIQQVESTDVNEYLREVTGEEFSAKDFRTWQATVLACEALCQVDAGETEKDKKAALKECVKQVASAIGNTPTVCRKYYIHPLVIEAFLAGHLGSDLSDKSDEIEDCLLKLMDKAA